MPCAPWLPPMTSSVGLPGARLKTASAFVLSSRSVSEVRTGVPVTSHFPAGKNCAHSSKPISTRVTSRPFSRFALPGIAFDSWTNVGIFRARPARIGAVEVNPPMPSTALGAKSRYSAFTWFSPARNFSANFTSATGDLLCMPTPGTRSMRNSPRPCVASESISFSEMMSITRCPRAISTSPTASPGNKCPPVPPAAMTKFIRYKRTTRFAFRVRALSTTPARFSSFSFSPCR